MIDIDWTKLSFSYTKTKSFIYSRCIGGNWEKPVVADDMSISLSTFAGIFH